MTLTIEQHPSPNHSTRGPHRVALLVMHATASTWASALGWLTNPASNVSAHYLIGVTGRIAQLVQEDRTAWHAGVSQWHNHEAWAIGPNGLRVPSVNPVSIGIELEGMNRPDSIYPDAQYQAAVALSRRIVHRYGIQRVNVVRHLDVAPKRKTDPAGAWPHAEFIADLYLVPQPAPLYRATDTAWVRKAPRLQAPRVGTVLRGALPQVVAIETGDRVDHPRLGVSDQWARLETGGYIWLPQLEAL